MRARVPYSSAGRLGAALVLLRPLLTEASWRARPLRSFESRAAVGSSENSEDATQELRRFTHSEEHSLRGGGILSLSWEVDAIPSELLSIDAEGQNGIGVETCSTPDGSGRALLVVRVPSNLVARASTWRHVVASRLLHRCSHLAADEHMYRRVHSVLSAVPHAKDAAISLVSLITEELASADQVFPSASYSFVYDPPEARNESLSRYPEPLRDRKRRLEGRASDADFALYEAPTTAEFGSFDDAFGSQNIFNFVPREVENFGWNWDFENNDTSDQQYKVDFPGGEAYALFQDPVLRAHAAFTLNFTARHSAFGVAPHVRIVTTLRGHGFLSTTFSGIMNANDSYSDDMLRQFRVPLLSGFEEETYLSPLEFYLGSVPIRIAPGIRLGLNAYHIGRFTGSLKLGISTHFKFKVAMDFDSRFGLRSNISTDLIDVSLNAPTWLLWTKHFEMGGMLEPELWLKGSFGDVKDARMNLDMRPYFNVSISQEGYNAAAEDALGMRHLAIYPFRATGLPLGEEFALRVRSNGHEVTTSNSLSFGVIDFSDRVENFDFGLATEEELLLGPIEVALMRQGSEYAKASIYCESLVNGECSPTPTRVNLPLPDGSQAIVHMSIFLSQEPFNALLGKMRSLRLVFPMLSVSPDVLTSWGIVDAAIPEDNLLHRVGMMPVEFRFLRNGRSFGSPMRFNLTDATHPLLTSDVIYELGRCYLDSWRTHSPIFGNENQALVQLLTPQLELLVNGHVVGKAAMPSIRLDQADTIFHRSSQWEMFEGALNRNRHGDIPIDFSLEGEQGSVVATGRMHILVDDVAKASFWIYPSQAISLPSNRIATLIWTVDAPPYEHISFTLRTMKVDESGGFPSNDSTQLVREFTQACSELQDLRVQSAKIKAYRTLLHTCSYSVDIEAASVAGSRIVVMLQWTRKASPGKTFEMISPPIDFLDAGLPQPSRRLGRDGFLKDGESPQFSESSDKFSIRRSVIDFKQKMEELQPTCDETPLEYSIGVGMYVKEFVHHVRLPKDLAAGMGGIEESPNYESDWLPIASREMSDDISDLFPSAVCVAGLCKGQLPGCQPEVEIPPIKIPHIRFMLSRPIPWTNRTSVEVRNVIAYGMSVLPEAIEVYSAEIEERAGGVDWLKRLKTSAAAGEASLVETAEAKIAGMKESFTIPDPGHLSHQRRLELESNAFEARIVTPLPFVVDKDLVAGLLHMGAWGGLRDGRERELGAVFIDGFSLRAPQDVHRQATTVAGGHSEASIPPSSPKSSTVGWPPAAMLSVGALVTAVIALSAFRSKSRLRWKQDYEGIAPEESTVGPAMLDAA